MLLSCTLKQIKLFGEKWLHILFASSWICFIMLLYLMKQWIYLNIYLERIPWISIRSVYVLKWVTELVNFPIVDIFLCIFEQCRSTENTQPNINWSTLLGVLYTVETPLPRVTNSPNICNNWMAKRTNCIFFSTINHRSTIALWMDQRKGCN